MQHDTYAVYDQTFPHAPPPIPLLTIDVAIPLIFEFRLL